MRRIYYIRLIVNARDLDDCEDADSLIEQIADLIDVGKLELGDCNPEHIAARMTDTRKSLEEIVTGGGRCAASTPGHRRPRMFEWGGA